MKLGTSLALVLVACSSAVSAFSQCSTSDATVNPLREAYYGDLHLHTSYSFDAYVLFGTKLDPDDAYRFAKGEVAQYAGQSVRRREPLDFLAITDHAENLGIASQLDDPESAMSRSVFGKKLMAELKSATRPDGRAAFDKRLKVWLSFLNYQLGVTNPLPEELKFRSKSAWRRAIEAANRHYAPGKFTTLIAYEWTAEPGRAILHRNVVFKGNSAPDPFTSFDSRQPEALWTWLETIRHQGYEALAIPHNANESNGLMYAWFDSAGDPIDRSYAERRAVNEPLSEISQTKGSSETHPLLSPNDEFADYAIMERVVGSKPYEPAGSYLRDAIGRGVVLQRKLAANPYKYGFVGASDLHTGLSVSAQADYSGFFVSGAPMTKDEAGKALLERTTAGSLTGVWAECNTRESIYGALRRRETFATSGTKVKFRFFGAWDFDEHLLQRKSWITTAYANGVPMGGDLPAKSSNARAPTFAIWAVKDPSGANLDRVQVIKTWEHDGQQQEKVFDVVWSGNRVPDSEGKLPAVGNTVDLRTGRYTNDIGATELKAIWTDPEFNSHRFAAYYLRALEIPTPRWSTLLAVRNGLALPHDVPATTQQRGWSSPIWYSPPSK